MNSEDRFHPSERSELRFEGDPLEGSVVGFDQASESGEIPLRSHVVDELILLEGSSLKRSKPSVHHLVALLVAEDGSRDLEFDEVESVQEVGRSDGISPKIEGGEVGRLDEGRGDGGRDGGVSEPGEVGEVGEGLGRAKRRSEVSVRERDRNDTRRDEEKLTATASAIGAMRSRWRGQRVATSTYL